MKSIHGQVHRRPITMLSSDSGKCGTVWGLCLSLGCTLPWPLFPSHFSVVVCSFFSSSFCLPLPSLHFFVLPLLPSSPRRHHFFFFISSASFVRFLFDEFLVFTKFHVVVMQFYVIWASTEPKNVENRRSTSRNEFRLSTFFEFWSPNSGFMDEQAGTNCENLFTGDLHAHPSADHVNVICSAKLCRFSVRPFWETSLKPPVCVSLGSILPQRPLGFPKMFLGSPNAHFVWNSALNRAHSSMRRPPREGRKIENCGGRRQKTRKFARRVVQGPSQIGLRRSSPKQVWHKQVWPTGLTCFGQSVLAPKRHWPKWFDVKWSLPAHHQ